jgi:hypothetical protein
VIRKGDPYVLRVWCLGWSVTHWCALFFSKHGRSMSTLAPDDMGQLQESENTSSCIIIQYIDVIHAPYRKMYIAYHIK